MGVITFIIGLIVGWKGWKFFNKLICIVFLVFFVGNLILFLKSASNSVDGLGEGLAFVLVMFVTAAFTYCVAYGITYFCHGKKVKNKKV